MGASQCSKMPKAFTNPGSILIAKKIKENGKGGFYSGKLLWTMIWGIICSRDPDSC